MAERCIDASIFVFECLAASRFLNNDGDVLRSPPRILEQLQRNLALSQARINNFNLRLGNLFDNYRMSGIVAVNNEKIDEDNGKDVLREAASEAF